MSGEINPSVGPPAKNIMRDTDRMPTTTYNKTMPLEAPLVNISHDNRITEIIPIIILFSSKGRYELIMGRRGSNASVKAIR